MPYCVRNTSSLEARKGNEFRGTCCVRAFSGGVMERNKRIFEEAKGLGGESAIR